PARAKVPSPKDQGTIEMQPLSGPTDGDLDFDTGQVLTLDQIVAQAEDAFGHKIQYDERMGSSRYFMSGKFTEPRLLAVISTVTEPLSVRQVQKQAEPDPAKMKADRDRILGFVYSPYRADRIGVAGLTVGDLIDGKDTTFGDLFGKKPPQAVSAFMYQYRIGADDKVRIEGDLYLAFAADGMAFLDSGQRDLNSNPIQYNAPLYVKFKF
ncbi:MAG TPA: hypothetical protein VNI20_04800, partial [Fimbriimonadaceae bacterium]|nr:hypothetical protein [Fimbriimonadaceae bacterium]